MEHDKTVLKTYVCFYTPGPDHWGSIALRIVENRDINALVLPKDTYQFYFFEAPVSKDPLGDEQNLSPQYVVAKQIMSQQQLRAYLENAADFKKRCANNTRVNHLTEGEIYAAVWNTKIKSAPLHALTRCGRIIHINNDTIVIDEDKKRLSFFSVRKPTRSFKL